MQSTPFFQSQRQIWQLAWPLILANLSIPLFSLTDAALLGHLSDAKYLAAATLGGTLVTLIFSSCNFLRMSSTGFSAHSKGLRDNAQAYLQQSFSRLLWQAGLIALLIVCLSPWISQLGLSMMNIRPELIDLSHSYSQIRLFSAPATLLSFVIIGVLVGQQHSRSALIMIVSANLTNIFLDVLFIYGFDLASNGAAIASLCSDYVALSLGLYFIKKQLPSLRLWPRANRSSTLMHKNTQLGMNRLLFLRSVSLMLVFNVFYAQSDTYGTNAVAANAILMQLILLQSYVLDGFANATEALVGESIGAGNSYTLQHQLKHTAIASTLAAMLLCFSFAVFEQWVVSAFTSIADVKALASELFIFVIIMPWLSTPAYWLDGVAIGKLAVFGKQASGIMLASVLLSFIGVFLPCWLLAENLEAGITGLWLSFCAFSLCRSLIMLSILKPSAP